MEPLSPQLQQVFTPCPVWRQGVCLHHREVVGPLDARPIPSWEVTSRWPHRDTVRNG